jgi:OOP family OmpA-OmpF porin
MNVSTKLLAAAVGVALSLSAVTVNAQESTSGFYAGAGVGQSFVDEGRYDDEDTAFSVFGGYEFNRYFALEAGYVDFGELEPTIAGPSAEADSTYLVAVGSVPITDKFSAYAKAGWNRWNVDTRVPVLIGSTDDSGSDPTYGVGVQYRLNDRVAFRGEYSRFELEETELDIAQLQVRVGF